MKPINSIMIFCAGVCLFLFTLTGCRKFVELDPPSDRVSSKILFSDSANATAAVLGIYIDALARELAPDVLNGGVTIYTGLYSDELAIGNTTDAAEIQFYTNSLNRENSVVWSIWRSAYLLVYKTNACIEGVEASTGLPAHVKRQLIGEAKFARACLYYNISKLYGDIPLAVTTDFATNAIMPKTAANLVIDQVIADLKAAKELLPERYITTGRARPNKFAAIALLARIHLERKNWVEAENEASLVLNNQATYVLEADLEKIFQSSSKEAIWQLMPPEEGQTVEGEILLPQDAGTIPKYILSTRLLNDFEAGDVRKEKWVKTNTIGGVDYQYPYKYKIRRGTPGQQSEPYTVFRVGELVLIRAEARAYLDNLTGAKDDLDLIRARAGLDPTTADDQASLIEAVLKERRIELFCEFGHRWTDLKRTGVVNNFMTILAPLKGGAWKPEFVVFPIPFEQTQINPFLKQNAGY